MNRWSICVAVVALLGPGACAFAAAPPLYHLTDLGTLGGERSKAYGINNGGQVVGWSYVPSGRIHHAFLYNDSTMYDWGTLGGAHSWAQAINYSGQVVGSSIDRFGANRHAFLYSDSSMYDLGTLGGNNSEAYGINNSGHVVGGSKITNDREMRTYHAFLYSDSTMYDLGNRKAYAINDSGQIVGQPAFLYNGSTTYDLNTLLDSSGDGWLLMYAYDINDAGQIVGYGETQGADRAFLLTPVPEPGTLVLLAGGAIAVTGFLGRRRWRTARPA